VARQGFGLLVAQAFASQNWQERHNMNPHQVPKAKKPYQPSVHLVQCWVHDELSKPLRQVRKVYCLNPGCTEARVITWVLGIALQHWPELHPCILTEMKYAVDEGVLDLSELHARRIKATWKNNMRRCK
jgi:hypothetical protein